MLWAPQSCTGPFLSASWRFAPCQEQAVWHSFRIERLLSMSEKEGLRMNLWNVYFEGRVGTGQ